MLRIPRPGFTFPGRIDRYVGILYTRILALVVAAVIGLSVIADLTGKIDDIVNNDIPAPLLFDFYKYASFQYFYELAPVAVLVAVLVLFGVLSRSNEVTAAKALGISLYRLAVPALVAAAGVAVLCGMLEARILPSANERVAQLEDAIRGREVVRSFRRADRNWLFARGRYIYNYIHYNAGEKSLYRLQVFQFDEEHNLVSRLYAGRGTYLGDGWRFEDSWTRTFDGVHTVSYQRHEEPALARFPETPDYFESEYKQPHALNFRELREYIAEVEGSGEAVPELWVELYRKVSYPVVCLVMGLVALPFSFQLGRKGALYGVGIGIALGLVFLGVFAFFTTLGETGALPPIVAVWAPNIGFALLSLAMFLGVET